jgi:hypothetical protein
MQRNRVPHIGAIDLFVVPTAGFKLLYGLVIVRLQRRLCVPKMRFGIDAGSGPVKLAAR